jgi:DNA-binding response OmpR family regulator
LLTDAGYAVVTAADIDAAFAELSAAPFDLILSDIKFSDNEFVGFAFFKKVQAMPQYAGLPFIFMSALTDGVIVRSGVQLGVDDYLTKPVEPELLTAVIEGKLKRYRAMNFQ